MKKKRKKLKQKKKIIKRVYKNKSSKKFKKKIKKLPKIKRKKNKKLKSKIKKKKTNFITKKVVKARSQFIGKSQIYESLKNKIILIENADPGYDWIFTRNIIGLITKYGGANSHMAIRSAEYNLPAAIGCGERMFVKLKNSRVIYLNCNEKLLKVIE